MTQRCSVTFMSVDAQLSLSEIRNRLHLTQDQFAKKLGISRPHLSKLENSSGEVSPKLASRIAEFCRMNGITGGGINPSARLIPVRSWAQAGSGIDFDELPLDWQKQQPTDCPDDEAFAVEIQGDSMEPKFLPGDIAVVMPKHLPRSGSLVIARLETEGVVFKIFTAKNERSGKICVFTSYNSVYQPIEVREESIIWNFPVYQTIRQVWR